MDFGLSDSVAGFCKSLSRWVGIGHAAGLWNWFVVPVQVQFSLACGPSGLPDARVLCGLCFGAVCSSMEPVPVL